MSIRWNIALFLALAAVHAMAKVPTLSGGALTTLDGQTTLGQIAFRFEGFSTVKGRVTLTALGRRVPFRGKVNRFGKLHMKVDTRDGIRGKLQADFFRKVPHGEGWIRIPEKGMARVKFRIKPAGMGAPRGDYDLVFEAVDEPDVDERGDDLFDFRSVLDHFLTKVEIHHLFSDHYVIEITTIEGKTERTEANRAGDIVPIVLLPIGRSLAGIGVSLHWTYTVDPDREFYYFPYYIINGRYDPKWLPARLYAQKMRLVRH